MDNGDVPADIQPVQADAHPLLGDSGPELAPDDARVVGRLGAAVVRAWFILPRDVQRHLFNLAAGSQDAEALRGDIARFLHETGGDR